jgi:hypothetical protein
VAAPGATRLWSVSEEADEGGEGGEGGEGRRPAASPARRGSSESFSARMSPLQVERMPRKASAEGE